ncbi:tyrosine-type recombinase/integrase [Desulfoplanes sp. PS50]
MSDWKPVTNRKGIKTNPGVYWKPLTTQKNGAVKDDVLYSIYYKFEGKPRREIVGRQSEGTNADECSGILARLKRNRREKKGPFTLEQERAENDRTRKEQEAEQRQAERDSLTYGQFFEETYFPHAQADKGKRSWEREETFHRLWVAPVIGEKPLNKVSQLDLERIKKAFVGKGRSPRTAHYCLATIRQVFNFAISTGILNGKNPVTSVKKPKVDNRRLRFLTRREAETLMHELSKRSKNLHDIALVSLRCGLRAGEVFSLTWADLDFERELLTLRDTKAGKNRVAYMTKDVLAMLRGRFRDQSPGELIFPDRTGKKRVAVSKSFRRAVQDLGFNKGVSDKRQEVCFHSLRHTFASWLVENGTDLFTVKELLGHSTLAMTERYSHLAPNTMRNAIKDLEQSMVSGQLITLEPGQRTGNE